MFTNKVELNILLISTGIYLFNFIYLLNSYLFLLFLTNQLLCLSFSANLTPIFKHHLILFSSISFLQGSTLEKKPWGKLAPKFLDLVASTNFWVAKNVRAENFYLKNPQYKLSTLPSLQREGKVKMKNHT